MKQIIYLILLLITVNSFAQKKILDHPDFEIWNTIQGQTISPNGKFMLYSLEKGEKDNFLKIKDNNACAMRLTTRNNFNPQYCSKLIFTLVLTQD